MGYKELSRALESVGVEESLKAQSNKINCGTSSFAFYLQCMTALVVDVVKLKD
jgi:hypothetical protein